MRFAQTACKFEGLHLCHQFFYDLMSLFGSLSLNVAKKRDSVNDENGLEGHHPRKPQKALQIASLTNGDCDSVKVGLKPNIVGLMHLDLGAEKNPR